MVTLDPKLNSFQQVVPGLFIGGAYGLTDVSAVRQAAIRVVIAVNGRATGTFTRGFPLEVVEFDIDDTPDFFMRPFFLPIHRAIDQSLSEGNNVIVVCTAGRSRSATAVISYLMRRRGMSLAKAFAVVKHAREFINPNPGFVMQLQDFEREMKTCELCRLEPRTESLAQFNTDDFSVVLCDQCDDPLIIANFHAQPKPPLG